METVSKKEIERRIQFENPWWGESASIDEYIKDMRPRAYLAGFFKLLLNKDVQRAIVLMGPRRVGKTVMIHHAIQKLINTGLDTQKICYISIDAPVYLGLSLDEMLRHYMDANNLKDLNDCYIFFDEIQYLKQWEIHLKKLVEDYRGAKFVGSGSAAAALKLRSLESGAGRFTNFLLPPLTFYEYLDLLGKGNLVHATKREGAGVSEYETANIEQLNEEFINYLNMGGYPEALFSETIKADPYRYIRSDIVDKVLMRDLPSLYGIQDIQELNRLFTSLAYKTGSEVSLDVLSSGSGVAKNTIKKYLSYLEAAFLITILHRVDQSGKRFKRANFFKVYLTNPSIRCALFGPVSRDHDYMGNIVETAIISQAVHSNVIERMYYARWSKGEVDLVYIPEKGITWCLEIKWSNRYYENPTELKSLIAFIKQHKSIKPIVTTVNKKGGKIVEDIVIKFVEASVYCYQIGRNIMIHQDVHKRIL